MLALGGSCSRTSITDHIKSRNNQLSSCILLMLPRPFINMLPRPLSTCYHAPLCYAPLSTCCHALYQHVAMPFINMLPHPFNKCTKPNRIKTDVSAGATAGSQGYNRSSAAPACSPYQAELPPLAGTAETHTHTHTHK